MPPEGVALQKISGTVWTTEDIFPIYATLAVAPPYEAVGTDEGWLYLIEEREP